MSCLRIGALLALGVATSDSCPACDRDGDIWKCGDFPGFNGFCEQVEDALGFCQADTKGSLSGYVCDYFTDEFAGGFPHQHAVIQQYDNWDSFHGKQYWGQKDDVTGRVNLVELVCEECNGLAGRVEDSQTGAKSEACSKDFYEKFGNQFNPGSTGAIWTRKVWYYPKKHAWNHCGSRRRNVNRPDGILVQGSGWGGERAYGGWVAGGERFEYYRHHSDDKDKWGAWDNNPALRRMITDRKTVKGILQHWNRWSPSFSSKSDVIDDLRAFREEGSHPAVLALISWLEEQEADFADLLQTRITYLNGAYGRSIPVYRYKGYVGMYWIFYRGRKCYTEVPYYKEYVYASDVIMWSLRHLKPLVENVCTACGRGGEEQCPNPLPRSTELFEGQDFARQAASNGTDSITVAMAMLAKLQASVQGASDPEETEAEPQGTADTAGADSGWTVSKVYDANGVALLVALSGLLLVSFSLLCLLCGMMPKRTDESMQPAKRLTRKLEHYDRV